MAAVVAILDFLLAHLDILYLLGADEHQVSIQLDYRDVQNMNSQHFSHINIRPIQMHGEANLTLL